MNERNLFHIPGMMMKDFIAEGGRVNMGIDLCGAYRLMTEHGLNGTEVGTAFQKSSGKRMAERMRRDGFLNAGLLRVPLYHNKDHRARKMTASAVQEHIIFLAWLDGHVATNGKPQVQFLDGLGEIGTSRSLRPLPETRIKPSSR